MSQDHSELIRLDLPASFPYLHLVGDSIAALLHTINGISDPETLTYNVQLAAHEACTNIINHAYKGAVEGRLNVTLTLMRQPASLVIELEDHGHAFDIGSVPEPDLEQAQVHGYGLFIIRNLMDTVTYTPQTGANQWRLVKQLA